VKFKTSGNISLKENKIFFLFSQIENQRFSTSSNLNIKELDYLNLLEGVSHPTTEVMGIRNIEIL